MKNNFLYFLGLALILLLCLYYTGLVSIYQLPSHMMEPVYSKDDYLITTNLVGNLRRKDVVIYKDPREGQDIVYIGRIMGLAGNKVELRNGGAYFNSLYTDRNRSLYRLYHLTPSNRQHLPERAKIIQIGETDFAIMPEFDALRSTIPFDMVAQDTIRRRFRYNQFPSVKTYHPSWTFDKFGPLVVPEDHVFILADFRDECIDSRLLGPIPIDKIIGRVLN